MPDRLAVYRTLRADLSPAARDHWDARPQDIERGIIHVGRFENYFRVFRERILRLVHSRRTVAALLEPRDAAGQRMFYEQTWNNLRWRLLFRVFFSRFVMGQLGRDPEFFRYVEGSVADRILAWAEHGLTAIPTHTNPYLDYILSGNYTRALPRYLQPQRFAAVRDGLDRLVVFHGPIDAAAQVHRGGGFDGYNLSDIFEYIDQDATREIYASLVDAARPGARLAYWNTLVPRGRPAELADRARPLAGLSAKLHEKDRAFFYGAFHVDEVIPITEWRNGYEGVLHTCGAGLRGALAAAG
jgi:S-adenosylmethionine-diacylglycerol 3-amino-3-carboxypropyl transferase